MENKFKYRPEIKSIEDLHPGDEFLVGDERWSWTDNRCLKANDVLQWWEGPQVAENLIRANVPIERDIPYPEGGAEKWELFERRDGEPCPPSARMEFYDGKWISCEYCYLGSRLVAIPKAKPQDKAKPAPKRVEFECNGSDFFQRYLPTPYYEDIISGKWGRIKVTLEPAEDSAYGIKARDTDQPGGKDK
jgi:hypothetical protein